jgi:hypothetical protein
MKRMHAQRIACAMTTAVMLFAMSVSGASAAIKTPPDRFVRTANYFLKAGTDITPDEYPALAKYDLLVLPAEAQIYNRDMFAKLRALNPNIIILAYVPSKSYNFAWNDDLHRKLLSGIQDPWWLTDPSGNRISIWPNTAVVSGVSPWNSYLPKFVHDEIWSTGLWDGIFYDEFSANASWMNGGNIDLHHDGKKGDPSLIDTAWQRGMLDMLKNTRDALGADAVIITNGDSTSSLQQYVNGRMFESFPTPSEAGGTWAGVMTNYVGLQKQVGSPPVFIINANTGDTGDNADYQKMRYGLTSTLMSDGFFSFDFGESDHGQLWHYDEEDANLGRPLGDAVNVLSPADHRLTASVWRRDYQNGVALVNASSAAKTVDLGGEFEKLHGVQDPTVNDGSVVTSVSIPADDGIILLKRLDQVTDATYPNGAFVRLFDASGAKVRNGFFSYDSSYAGNADILSQDIDGDGVPEKIVSNGGRVSVYGADGALRTSFSPFGDASTQTVSIAVGDVNGDGKEEIVTGAGAGGLPQVRVFTADGKPIGPGFLAYGADFRGGVNVAVGDLYGTGSDAIVTGAGAGGGPQVRIFNRNGKVLNVGWYAYDSRFRGGVSVAVGDVNGDGKEEIVTGAGAGGGPQVRIFSRKGTALGKGFFADDPGSRTGVIVAVIPAAENGAAAQIATMTTDVFQFSATP